MYETNHFRTFSRNKYKIISITCTLLNIKSIMKVYFSMGRYLFDGITIDSLFLVTSMKNNNLANCILAFLRFHSVMRKLLESLFVHFTAFQLYFDKFNDYNLVDCTFSPCVILI